MLLMGQQLINKPVLSLRTGGVVGTALEPIINPSNLKIEGWWVDDTSSRQRRILLSLDIRDIIEQGFVVNDHDALSDPDELVRLKDTLKIGFELVGKPVIDSSKHKLGKVNDYAFEKDGFFVNKLYTDKSILRSLSGQAAIIDRSQIVEISRRVITVMDATTPGKVTTVQQPLPQQDASPA